MNLNELSAISPVDGRYRGKLKQLAGFYSEFALIKYRVRVEIEYFLKLVEFLGEYQFSNTEKEENEGQGLHQACPKQKEYLNR